jgi:hypothetical protein
VIGDGANDMDSLTSSPAKQAPSVDLEAQTNVDRAKEPLKQSVETHPPDVLEEVESQEHVDKKNAEIIEDRSDEESTGTNESENDEDADDDNISDEELEDGKDTAGDIVPDRMYSAEEMCRLKVYKFKSVTIPLASGNVQIRREPIFRLVTVLCKAFKHPHMYDMFLDAIRETGNNPELVGSIEPFGIRIIADCLQPYVTVSKNIDLKSDISSLRGKRPRFSALKLRPAEKKLDLTDDTTERPSINSANVSDYITSVDGLRVSTLFLSLFVNMGVYEGATKEAYTPPCFFSQPSFNNRNLIRSDVNKYATGLYDKTCIFQYTEEMVIIPYIVGEYDNVVGTVDGGVDIISSVALGGKTRLVSQDDHRAEWFRGSTEIDYLFLFFFDKTIEDLLPVYLPKNIEKDSIDDFNFRFCIFLEQLSEKFNGLSTHHDWVQLYKLMEKKLGLERAFKYRTGRTIQWLWHHCHVMMCAISSVRIATGEGNHRMQSIFVALFNLLLHQSVTEVAIPKYKKATIFSRKAMKDTTHQLQISKIMKEATVTASWPKVFKMGAIKHKVGLHEMNILKVYSTLQQDKKEGSVSRNMNNVLSSYLTEIRNVSRSAAPLYNDYYQVHLPGSRSYIEWCLESCHEDPEKILHKEAPNVILKIADAANKETSSVQTKAKGEKDVEKQGINKSTNKYLNDDTSTGLDARAMVAFREHIIKNVLKDDCREILEMRGLLIDSWCLDDTDGNKGFDTKNEFKPRKLPRPQTSPDVIARHIGYGWTIERSIHGCLFVNNLSQNSIRPGYLWPIVFLVTNFVHDEISLDLMLQLLSNNGMPNNASRPLDVTEIVDYPKLFNSATKSYSHMIVYGFLKPQMMLYDAFLALFKVQYKTAGEINIRNRFMLSIGKSWLKVIHKFGLWIKGDDIRKIHSKLKMLITDKAADFPHAQATKSEGPGTNLPQVAAYVCHLLNVGVFEWANFADMGSWKKKTGAFEQPSSPPTDWDVFVPIFKLNPDTCIQHAELEETRMKIEDIVEWIVLGSFNNGSSTLGKFETQFRAWNHWSIGFDIDYCKQYIEANKKPEEKKEETGPGESDVAKKRTPLPSRHFRQKMFAVPEYKKYLVGGDNPDKTLNIQTNTQSFSDVSVYKERLGDMSTAMMEAAMYLRYQRELLSIHAKEKAMKICWNPQNTMNVLHEQGGKESRPFYNPLATKSYLDMVDEEMKVLAEVTYKKAKDKGKDSPKNLFKVICAQASEAAFDVSASQYQSIRRSNVDGEELEKKRKGAAQSTDDEPPSKKKRDEE